MQSKVLKKNIYRENEILNLILFNKTFTISKGEEDVYIKLAAKNAVLLNFLSRQTSLDTTDSLSYKFSLLLKAQTVLYKYKERTIFKCLEELSSLDLPCILVKGVALRETYEYFSLVREYSDCDILICDDNTEEINSYFRDSGFYNPRGWDPIHLQGQYIRRRKINGHSVDFDIHLQLSSDQHFESIFSYKRMLNRSKNGPFKNVKLPHDFDILYHTLYHFLYNYNKNREVKLSWVIDIYLLSISLDLEILQSDINPSFLSVAEFVYFILQLKFEVELFRVIYYTLKTRRKKNSNKQFYYFIKTKNNKAFMFNNLKSRRGIFLKLHYLIQLFFPPPIELYNKFGRVNSVFLPYYYLKRMLSR